MPSLRAPTGAKQSRKSVIAWIATTAARSRDDGTTERELTIPGTDRWRICFVWKDGAEDVEIVDYHR